MIRVYILYSATLNRYYAGLSNQAGKRLKQHRHGQSCWTSRAADWTQVFSCPCASYAEARALEKKIKATGARRFLDRLLPNPAEAGQG